MEKLRVTGPVSHHRNDKNEGHFILYVNEPALGKFPSMLNDICKNIIISGPHLFYSLCPWNYKAIYPACNYGVNISEVATNVHQQLALCW
jgi:hypothetical protein